MNYVNIFIILVLLIFIGGIYLLITSKKKIPTTKKPKSYCEERPDDPNCQTKTIRCDILDSMLIKKCDDDSSICSKCQCVSDPTKILGCMNCQEIKENNQFLISVDKEECKDPFSWNDNLNHCYLKPGKYCLPTQINDIECNKFTGNKVLTKKDEISSYKWTCICKDNDLFSSFPNPGDDCVGIKVCGMQGKPNPSNLNYPGRKLVKYNKEDELWTGDNFDPILEGKCICNLGESSKNLPCDHSKNNYINCRQNLVCEPNNCGLYQQDINDKNKCICPPNTINCYNLTIKQDNMGSSYNIGLCKYPSCLPDPCNTDGIKGNYYDINNSTCICDQSQGYYPYIDENSELPTCKKLCKDNGPCAERGKCFIPKLSETKKWNFSKITQDQSSFYTIKTDENLYLTTDGQNLSLNQSIGNDFVFQITLPKSTEQKLTLLGDSPNENFNVPFLSNNVQYNIVLLNKNNLNNVLGYLNFISLKFESYNENNKDSYNFLFSTDKSISNEGVINILDKKVFLSYNGSKIMTNSNLNNREICKCCISPYTQSEDLLCSSLKLVDDNFCNKDDCRCASGSCESSFLTNFQGRCSGGKVGELSSSQFPGNSCNLYNPNLYTENDC